MKKKYLEKGIPSELRHKIINEMRFKIIDDLRLVKQYNIIMQYQKIINLVDDTTNQSSEFRTRNWIEINGKSRGACNN